LQQDTFLAQQYAFALQQIEILSKELESSKELLAQKTSIIEQMTVAQEALADANIRIAELYGELEEAYEKIARSEEIANLNHQLAELNQEYQAANEELCQTLEIIREQNQTISFKNQKITSSLTYAKRIQEAILPLPELLHKCLGKNNFFILYMPKDIVSGDFYWVEKNEKYTMLTVADCTGHGIPGAFMSMIGTQLLHEIIVQKQVYMPNQVLMYLNDAMRRVLKQEATMNKDGMEMIMLTIDHQYQKILYAGAMNPLFYVKHTAPENNELIEIKATKRPIGGYEQDEVIEYELHTINLDVPTTLYLSTDGFQDQFGGVANRKFMARVFKELLATINNCPITQQYEMLQNAIENWIGTRDQTDDITVMGMHIIPNPTAL
jgi:serine phosphatase RsbU (regulator of sigma subunit)